MDTQRLSRRSLITITSQTTYHYLDTDVTIRDTLKSFDKKITAKTCQKIIKKYAKKMRQQRDAG